jgi:hypothetical protein
MKKRLIALALLSAASTSSNAADATFTATVNAISDAGIAQTTALHFGAMQPTVGAACTMADTGVVTGDCDAANANIAIGLITVSGLTANVPLNISVQGIAGTNVTFVPEYDINGAAAASDNNAENSPSTPVAITTNATGDNLLLDIYGVMTVTTALTPGQAYTSDYTVDVSFQ